MLADIIFRKGSPPSRVLRAEVQMAREGLEVESWATWGPGCPSGAQGLRHKHKDGSLWKHRSEADPARGVHSSS